MISLGGALLIIVGIPSMVVMLAFLVGFLRMRADRRLFSSGGQEPPEVPLEILVPVKGVFPDQESILASLLKQDYASYGVMFIIEGEQDPANALIDKLCAQFPIARKVISGVSNACGQKNYNLVKGAGELRPETDIIVFCDSTNAAQPCWLRNFTAPLRAGKVEVVTTFR
ncbi:MAG: glycosyltransferase, partial [Deltaproteobacteria bacterium]|nr:glycosyltransferase [Deltaproteobacteria bacterium]